MSGAMSKELQGKSLKDCTGTRWEGRWDNGEPFFPSEALNGYQFGFLDNC